MVPEMIAFVGQHIYFAACDNSEHCALSIIWVGGLRLSQPMHLCGTQLFMVSPKRLAVYVRFCARHIYILYIYIYIYNPSAFSVNHYS